MQNNNSFFLRWLAVATIKKVPNVYTVTVLYCIPTSRDFDKQY